MPVFRSRKNFGIAWGIRAFFNLDASLTRSVVPSVEQMQSRLMQAQSRVEQMRKRLSNKDRQLAHLRGRLSEKNRLVAALRDDQPEPVRASVRNLRDEIRIAKIIEESAERFRVLAGKKGLKVNLGCGEDIRPGWVNIDLAPGVDPAAHSDAAFISCDLRLGLPLEEASCDYVYSSHFFEHLEYKHGLQLMRDCHRVLRPGGVFRVSLPNLKGIFDAYLRGDEAYFDLIDKLALLPEVEPGIGTLVDHINYSVYQYGEHKYIYDEDKVILLLQKIGYSSVTLSSYQEGMDPGEEVRRRYSFYVEAVK